MFSTDCILLPESLRPYVRNNSLAIDSGITRTRIISTIDNDPQQNSLRYICVENNQLKSTLDSIGDVVKGDMLKQVFVTGFRKQCTKSIVESIFDVEVIVVDESLAISNGFELVANHLTMDDIEYKIRDMTSLADKYKVDENNPMLKQFRKAYEFKPDDDAEIHENKINVPSILIMSGSNTRYFLVNKDKSMKLLDTIFIGRGPIGGLSKCLIDDNNTSNIIEMAGKGNRENVDTQVWEMFSEDEKSPYGKLPPNVPIFAFGKSADYNIQKEDFNQVDLMDSLCNLIFNMLIATGIQFCKMTKAKSLYICGVLFNALAFEKHMFLLSRRIASSITSKMIKCDYMLALGTLKK